MFLIFFIQAYIALTGIVTSFIGSSLNLFSQSAFDLILDIPTVAYFFSTVHNSSDANTPVVASTGNESTTDICTWGIPGLLALRPVALPPSIINVPTREIQLYHAHSLALSLIVRDPASCPFLGPQTTDDITLESSTEPILNTSTETNITTTSSPASNDDLSDDPCATAALVLRLIFISGLCSIGMLGTVVFVEIERQRIQDETDSCESTVSFFLYNFSFYFVLTSNFLQGHKMVDVDSGSTDSTAKDAQVQACISHTIIVCSRRPYSFSRLSTLLLSGSGTPRLSDGPSRRQGERQKTRPLQRL